MHDNTVSFERVVKAVDGDRVTLDAIPYAMHCMFSCASIMGFVDQIVASIKKTVDFAYTAEAIGKT